MRINLHPVLYVSLSPFYPLLYIRKRRMSSGRNLGHVYNRIMDNFVLFLQILNYFINVFFDILQIVTLNEGRITAIYIGSEFIDMLLQVCFKVIKQSPK